MDASDAPSLLCFSGMQDNFLGIELRLPVLSWLRAGDGEAAYEEQRVSPGISAARPHDVFRAPSKVRDLDEK